MRKVAPETIEVTCEMAGAGSAAYREWLADVEEQAKFNKIANLSSRIYRAMAKAALESGAHGEIKRERERPAPPPTLNPMRHDELSALLDIHIQQLVKFRQRLSGEQDRVVCRWDDLAV